MKFQNNNIVVIYLFIFHRVSLVLVLTAAFIIISHVMRGPRPFSPTTTQKKGLVIGPERKGTKGRGVVKTI